MRPRALVFDVFARSSTGARASPRRSATARFREIPRSWRTHGGRATRRSWRRSTPGRGRGPTSDELHLPTLDDLLAEWGQKLPLESKRRLVAAWHRLDPWPDAPAGLEAVRRGHITAALSNGHIALPIDLARHGQLRFDTLLSAEVAGVYKPAAEAYLTAAQLLGVPVQELMLVAAHPWDLGAGRAAGPRTAFIDRPLEHGPGSPSHEYRGADQSVSGLGELLARLGN